MQKAIIIAQIVISVLLIISILLQNRGSGLSSVFGGSGGIYRTKRGLEKILYAGTIILVVLFVAIGVINLVISA